MHHIPRTGMPFSLPKTMMAYRFHPLKHEPVLRRASVSTAAPGSVLVKILAAVVCHSDIGILEPDKTMRKSMDMAPFVLGHEATNTNLVRTISLMLKGA